MQGYCQSAASLTKVKTAQVEACKATSCLSLCLICTAYRECCSYSHHIYKRVWTPVVGEKLTVDIEEDASDPKGSLQFECLALLSATYQ